MTIIQSNDVRRRFAKLRQSRQIFVADGRLSVPKKSWLLGPGREWWKAHLEANDFTYSAQDADCDDFALRFKAKINDAHRAHAVGKAKGTGLSVGIFWYFINADPQLAHAINGSIVFDDLDTNSLEIVYTEPQTPETAEIFVKDLRQYEIDTQLFAYF